MRRSAHLHEIESLAAWRRHGPDLTHCVVQGLDLREASLDPDALVIDNTTFLGCRFDSPEVGARLQGRGALILPALPALPYRPYRGRLYTWQELMDGYDEADDRSLDRRIYEHMQAANREGPSVLELLAQRLHDHAMDDALEDFLGKGDDAHRVVGIMGGHGTLRTDPWYRRVAETSGALTRAGYLVASGGGPGVMEAANLGAYLAPGGDDALTDALALLAHAPRYHDPGFVDTARQVLDHHPEGAPSLAIPTWFYGHEPSNLFGSAIAKYFSNSLREDTLLAGATHGVVFAPGGGGTTQEIFQDACQNHYATFDVISPMVFLGRHHYLEHTGIVPTLQRLAAGRPYADLIHLTDEPTDIVDFIRRHPPRPGGE